MTKLKHTRRKRRFDSAAVRRIRRDRKAVREAKRTGTFVPAIIRS